jgi:hypothetical protein
MASGLPCNWVIPLSQHAYAGSAPVQTTIRQEELDLVVPFTTPDLTRAALSAASRMGAGLGAAVRLVKIQCVPYPLDLIQSPVYTDFLRQQMNSFSSALPLTGEIRFAREFEQGLAGTLNANSVVVLSFRKRPWRTRNERLAASLQRSGRKVIILSEGTN